jgi:hypothetical protein
MKKLFLVMVMLFAGSYLFSQTMDDYMEVQREALKTEKKAIVAEAMQLTDAESEVFWPLYNEYNNKMYTFNTDRYKLVKQFAENYELMSNENAIELWQSAMKNEQELLNLQKQYFKKFQKILPGRKVMRYFQVENKIRTLINAQLAVEIPLVEQ